MLNEKDDRSRFIDYRRSLLLNACHGPSNRIAQPPASAGWCLLTDRGSEPQDYKAYNYVIFTRRNFKDHPELKAQLNNAMGRCCAR